MSSVWKGELEVGRWLAGSYLPRSFGSYAARVVWCAGHLHLGQPPDHLLEGAVQAPYQLRRGVH